MTTVHVTGPARECALLIDTAHNLRGPFAFSATSGEVELHILPHETARPFFVRGLQPFVSAWNSDVFGAAHRGAGEYLLLMSVLALLQWRTLSDNPLLVEEDLVYSCEPHCLFAPKIHIDAYAPLVSKPYCCDGCRRFYDALCRSGDLQALDFALSLQARCAR